MGYFSGNFPSILVYQLIHLSLARFGYPRTRVCFQLQVLQFAYPIFFAYFIPVFNLQFLPPFTFAFCFVIIRYSIVLSIFILFDFYSTLSARVLCWLSDLFICWYIPCRFCGIVLDVLLASQFQLQFFFNCQWLLPQCSLSLPFILHALHCLFICPYQPGQVGTLRL